MAFARIANCDAPPVVPESAPTPSSSSSSGSAAPPAKRQKIEEGPSNIRVRQILLRHTLAAARPIDGPRGKPVKRSIEEAESQMLPVLEGLVAAGSQGFSAACRASSECQSALRGGDLAGDLGWIDRKSAEQKQKDKAVLKVQLPDNALKAAFGLAVGELSDIITSDRGVHLLLRTA
mmetsp:Transcript_31950/g.101547  ORF Transcript_31950/g.101547 Transcript_31950/m.101547 type:complete len:177 (+) Transcript_31950:1705-2235(+)